MLKYEARDLKTHCFKYILFFHIKYFSPGLASWIFYFHRKTTFYSSQYASLHPHWGRTPLKLIYNVAASIIKSYCFIACQGELEPLVRPRSKLSRCTKNVYNNVSAGDCIVLYYFIYTFGARREQWRCTAVHILLFIACDRVSSASVTQTPLCGRCLLVLYYACTESCLARHMCSICI